MSYTIRVGGDDIQARLVNQAQRAQRMNHGILTCVCVCTPPPLCNSYAKVRN